MFSSSLLEQLAVACADRPDQVAAHALDMAPRLEESRCAPRLTGPHLDQILASCDVAGDPIGKLGEDIDGHLMVAHRDEAGDAGYVNRDPIAPSSRIGLQSGLALSMPAQCPDLRWLGSGLDLAMTSTS